MSSCVSPWARFVEGVGTVGIEADEATDLLGMAAADRTQLFANLSTRYAFSKNSN
jgi:hypothetical protein